MNLIKSIQFSFHSSSFSNSAVANLQTQCKSPHAAISLFFFFLFTSNVDYIRQQRFRHHRADDQEKWSAIGRAVVSETKKFQHSISTVSFNIHHFHYVNWLQKLPLIRSDETFVDLSRETVVVLLLLPLLLLLLRAAAAVELLIVSKLDDEDDVTVVASINWLQLIRITINTR
jgi:hypothetical protein